MEEFSSCTFHNYLQYLLVLLGMPADISEYEGLDGFKEKVKLILQNWSKLHGDTATLGLLTEKLRNHRSISRKILWSFIHKLLVNFNILSPFILTEKIYDALKANLKLQEKEKQAEAVEEPADAEQQPVQAYA
jgi:hypothetical protein